ncbi:hypothetical protein [Providencia burhodogranariea]|uniref:Uncharacterized protein n=1 Tax=Providencia burhodogranariea DSM 19968 TaxID=1141662 RepID=K8WXB1_9GAMM|nr:hypothetical protein [Providencia burhodogranariea]EKT62027.1 hypothetical protein OOA_09051 [Providencia burhodogranariea DSM 19968]
MKKLTLVTSVLILFSYNGYSLSLNSNELHSVNTLQYNEKNQYFYGKMNNNNSKGISELVWSKEFNNNHKKTHDFSTRMLSARDNQSNRQLLNERQEQFLQGIDREDSSNKITLTIPAG